LTWFFGLVVLIPCAEIPTTKEGTQHETGHSPTK
jgi:hypothetical protein